MVSLRKKIGPNMRKIPTIPIMATGLKLNALDRDSDRGETNLLVWPIVSTIPQEVDWMC